MIFIASLFFQIQIIEGSGDDSGSKHSVSSPDMEIHGSGYGSDDEDGDSVHGSGSEFMVSVFMAIVQLFNIDFLLWSTKLIACYLVHSYLPAVLISI